MREKCPKCGRMFQVVNTIVRTEYRVQYLGCRECKVRPENNTVHIPLQYAPRRVSR